MFYVIGVFGNPAACFTQPQDFPSVSFRDSKIVFWILEFSGNEVFFYNNNILVTIYISG